MMSTFCTRRSLGERVEAFYVEHTNHGNDLSETYLVILSVRSSIPNSSRSAKPEFPVKLIFSCYFLALVVLKE